MDMFDLLGVWESVIGVWEGERGAEGRGYIVVFDPFFFFFF